MFRDITTLICHPEGLALVTDILTEQYINTNISKVAGIEDDLLATGGTAEAAVNLIEKCGGRVHHCCFVVNLPDLGGKNRLQELGRSIFTVCEFEGE